MNPRLHTNPFSFSTKGQLLTDSDNLSEVLLAWAPSQHVGACGRVQRQGVGSVGGGKVQIAWKGEVEAEARTWGAE